MLKLIIDDINKNEHLLNLVIENIKLKKMYYSSSYIYRIIN